MTSPSYIYFLAIKMADEQIQQSAIAQQPVAQSI